MNKKRNEYVYHLVGVITKAFKYQINEGKYQGSEGWKLSVAIENKPAIKTIKVYTNSLENKSVWKVLESENYLKKPIYDIIHYKINQQRTNFYEDREIQKHEILLINIYKEVAKNYNGKFDWNELQILDILSKQEKSGLILQSDEQTELIRLKSKYNLNNPNNDNHNQIINSNPTKLTPYIIGAIVIILVGLIAYWLVKRNKEK